MGDLTLTQLQAELTLKLGNRSNDSTIDDTVKTRWLNQAQRRVAIDVMPKEIEASFGFTVGYTGTAATDKRMALASVLDTSHSLLKPRSLLVYTSGTADERNVIELTLPLYRQRYGVVELHGTSKPQHFVIWGAYLWWGPVPDVAYLALFDYYRYPADLSAAGGTSDLNKLDEAIILAAAAWGMRSLNNKEAADSLDGDYQKFLASVRINREPTGARRFVPGGALGIAGPAEYWKDPFRG